MASAGSRISSLKDYVTSRDGGSGWRSPRATTPGEERQGWRAWAGQKIRVRRGGGYDANNGNAELVNVFPGWAARRYAAEITAEGASVELMQLTHTLNLIYLQRLGHSRWRSLFQVLP